MPVRKPSAMSEVGERVAALSASFEAELKYSHDRWHKLNNDLTPLVQLPERLTRDIAKLQGTFDGRMAAMSKDMERSIQLAVERAVDPVRAEMRDHDQRIVALEAAGERSKGAKGMLETMARLVPAGGFGAAIALFIEKMFGVLP